MAKDPAFLFYSSDFLSGISDLTMEERGQYITLLCLQHQKGALSEKTIRLSVGSVSVDVLSKFSKDKEGNFFNERLNIEIEKRSKFTESRRNNGLQGGRGNKKAKPSENHMGNHMEDINENRNKDKIEEKNNLELPFQSKEFFDQWSILRQEKKWRKKSIHALKAALNKLAKETEQDAIQMITNTIAGEWAGIFELKTTNNYGKSTNKTSLRPTGVEPRGGSFYKSRPDPRNSGNNTNTGGGE